MTAPLTDFLQLFRRITKFLRYAGLVFTAITLWLVGREVVALSLTLAAVHPALAVAFDVAVVVLAYRLLGVPVWRFLRMPAVVTPPKMPATRGEWNAGHVRLRVAFLVRYVEHLRKNPVLAAKREALSAAAADLERLARETARQRDPGPGIAAIERFEVRHLNPLLAPLDREAEKLIRREALAVGVATAVSPNGTIDAFLVLWRNANLVSRLANLYYGKPGVRGSLRILRDVSSAALFATCLEGLSEAVGGVLKGVLGSVAGVLAGPVVDGSVNALATLRIGYLAKGRCRSFSAFTEATRRQVVLHSLAEARARSAGVVREVAKSAGGLVAGISGKVGEAVKGGLSSILRKFRTEEQPGTA